MKSLSATETATKEFVQSLLPESSNAAAAPSSFAEILRRRAALLALWRRPDYRRNSMAIFILTLRRSLGWRFLAAVLTVPALVAYACWQMAGSARDAYAILLGLVVTAAVGLGAAGLASEKEGGTLELLFLATGNARAVLRLRQWVDLVLLAALLLPAWGAASHWHGDLLAAAPLLMLLTTGWVVLAANALAQTWFPSSWSAALLALGLAAIVYTAFRESTSILNPFINPIARENGPRWQRDGVGTSTLLVNRAVVLIAAGFLLRSAAGRLRKAMG